jgi:hypothetical protein
MEFQSIAKGLITAGLILALLGCVLWFLPKVPWLGKLPGDITIQKENFSFYFPLVTCLMLSLVLSLLANLFKK